jgi:asparagine synthase (glutamine-hydrolysing)
MGSLLAALAVHGEPTESSRAIGSLGVAARRAAGKYPLPLLAVDVAVGFDLAFDGRLDNRNELIAELGVERLPDAALAAHAMARWGEGALERFLGPFALAVLDWRHRRALLARDALGGRSVVYLLNDDFLIAGTEEQAVARHPEVSDALDETTLARHFATLPPLRGATFFRDIRVLEPGKFLVVEPARSWFGEFGALRAVETAGSDARELVAEFGSRLRQAVACRLEPGKVPAVLMSGGMDSTSVAVVAAELAAAGAAPGPVRTFSWIFDDFRASDERRFMTPVVERWAMRPTWIRGDGYWPLRDVESWPVNPSTPVDIPLRWLQESAYRAAREAGVGSLLTGECGDELWVGGSDWLWSLLTQGRIAAAAAEILVTAWHEIVLRRRMAVSLRLAASRVRYRGGRGRQVSWRAPPWITPKSRELVVESLRGGNDDQRTGRMGAVLDPLLFAGRTAGRYWAARYGLELRAPFRDRRLIELALGLPAELLYLPGRGKWALRETMSGRLPEATRRRRWTSSQMPLIQRGLAEREVATARKLLAPADALWRPYVSEDWLSSNFPQLFQRGEQGRPAVAIWNCLAAELWRKARLRSPKSCV